MLRWYSQWDWDDLLCCNAAVPTAEVSRPGRYHYGTSGASSCPAEWQDRWSCQVEHDHQDIERSSVVHLCSRRRRAMCRCPERVFGYLSIAWGLPLARVRGDSKEQGWEWPETTREWGVGRGVLLPIWFESGWMFLYFQVKMHGLYILLWETTCGQKTGPGAGGGGWRRKPIGPIGPWGVENIAGVQLSHVPHINSHPATCISASDKFSFYTDRTAVYRPI